MGDIGDELVEAVRVAAENRTRLSIKGGGSKFFIGREIIGESLDITRHSGILEYEPTELVLTARAGTSIKDVTKLLADNDQICPFEPFNNGGDATLGGTLACNISGPARPWRGSIRDAMLGARLINGHGEHLKFGGQVLKNVAGYDVTRLQAGAMGTLGVITEMTFRVLPKPAAIVTLVNEMEASDAILRMTQLMGRPWPLSGVTWVANKLYIRLQGAERAVEGAIRELGADTAVESHPVWEGIREQSLQFFAGDLPTWRFSVDATSTHRMADQSWLVDWGGALRWLRGHYGKNELETLAHEMGGHVSLFRHGNRTGEIFHTLTPAMQILQKNLKNAFDPLGILNPGRMYSWL